MAILFKIEKDVPRPENVGKGRTSKYRETFDAMVVSDSIGFSTVDEYDKVTRASYQYGQKFNKRFAGMKSQLRVWRIE